MAQFTLRLYVAGETVKTHAAIRNIRSICESQLRDEYELQIIDVLKRPQLAEDEKILATPTLVRVLPPPLRRLIGDLSDRDKVLVGLDLRGSSDDKTLEPANGG